MDIRDSFYQDGVSDCLTCVLNERNPLTGSYTMLATDYEARMCSPFTEGHYDPNGDKEHVGRSVGSIGKRQVSRC